MTALRSIIIPACGSGSRFGVDLPKHLLDIGGKPMVQRVIDELPGYTDVYLLVQPKYHAITKTAIQGAHVVPVAQYHMGACETILSAPIHRDSRTLVVNCDNVIVPPKGWDAFFALGNAIVTFREEHNTLEPPPFSYVRVHNGRVIEIAEKRRVGPLACAGAFLFWDFATLRMLCQWHLTHDRPDVRFEWYLAPVYSRLIDDPGSRIHSVLLDPDDKFIRMGTPIEADEARNYYVHGSQGQQPGP